jgi:3-deoxy-7-phosphoheptulonate synthase/chorismate mutase
MTKKSYSIPIKGIGKRRKKIDSLDLRLLGLLNKRLSIALEIRKIKKRMGLKIYDPLREKEVIKRLASRNRGPLKKEDVRRIFSTFMRISRKSKG